MYRITKSCSQCVAKFRLSKVDEGEEAVCGFAAADCDAASVHELIEEAIDAVAQSIT